VSGGGARHRAPASAGDGADTHPPRGSRWGRGFPRGSCASGIEVRGEVGKEGLELSPLSPENTAISDSGGAYSGALPANLKHVVNNWDSLTDEDHRRIRAIVDGRLA